MPTPSDFPSDLYYTKNHEWLRVEDDGQTATIGITAFAQHELGDIVYVELDADAGELDADAVFGTVEAVKTVSELYMPLAGEVIAVNEALEAQPELVNEDAYGEGWMVKIRMANPEDVSTLLSNADYAEIAG